MRDHDDYAKAHPRMRSLFLKAMYPLWHKDEMVPQPPAFAVNLHAEMPPGPGAGFVCFDCGRAYAERPRWTMTVSTATGHHTVARCAECAARHNYEANR